MCFRTHTRNSEPPPRSGYFRSVQLLFAAFLTEAEMSRLKNKRTLVTGGSSGIGLETARRFLHEGARVAITGSNRNALDVARKQLGNVLAIHADEGDAAAQKKVAADIHDNFGGLDTVFINAGVGDFRPVCGSLVTIRYSEAFRYSFLCLCCSFPAIASNDVAGCWPG